jgi:site-specific DNA recombinase
MRLIAYIRVSTDAQRDNTSLAEQKIKIDAYCKAYGHKVVKYFQEVGSGKSTETRAKFQEALLALPKADGLIATKLDRIARNVRDVLVLVEDVLKPVNKDLVLLDINLDTTTPIGKFMLTSMAAVAALERDVIIERTQGGRRAKAAKGGYAYGAPPFGHQAVNKELALHEQEQQALELMRKHRRSGKSFHAIARYMNEQGIPAKKGGVWYPSRVQEVLKKLARQPKVIDVENTAS